MSDVSEAWIQPRMTSTGFLPDVGVHLRGRAVVQEVSRSVWVGAVAMCCMALVALIPISVIGLDVPYYVQIIAALGCVWGAICVVVGTKWIFHGFGTSVTFDLDLQTIVVCSDGRKIIIPAGRVIGLQVLRGPRDTGGYQLNLVFRQETGDIARESLTTNAIRYYVTRIAKAYQRFAGWPVLELTGNQST